MSRFPTPAVLLCALVTLCSSAAIAESVAIIDMPMADPLLRTAPYVPDLVAQLDVIRAQAVRQFWTYQALLAALFLGGSYVLGRFVQRRGWVVGYTRKANALMLYVLPYFALTTPSPYPAMMTVTLSLGVFAVLLMMMSAPVRTRIPALATAFASLDRPEDRPFTLTWLLTSVLAVWAVMIVWVWAAPSTVHYVFVAFFISGVGDALAEPVGLYFGRKSYVTRALFTDKRYIRTYVGSATVFASGVIAVLILTGLPFGIEGWLALLLFPIVATLAEAKSPHTWDQPFIIASCGLIAYGLSFV